MAAPRNVLTKVGRVAFCSLIEPKQNLKDQMEWIIALELSEADSKPLLDLVEQEIDRAQKESKTFPRTGLNQPFRPSMEKDPNDPTVKVAKEGYLLWVFKRAVMRKTNPPKERTAPILYDTDGAICNGKVTGIGSGSTGRVVFNPYTYHRGQQAGVGFGLEGFQIHELRYSQAPSVPALDGGWRPEGEEEKINLMDLAS